MAYRRSLPRQSQETATDNARDSTTVARAYKNKDNAAQITGSGVVIRHFADDTSATQHQKFIIKLNLAQALLITHNIDCALRISFLRKGDTVKFYGEYKWSAKGGVVHWTHHDPKGNHVSGWLKYNGNIYQ